MPTFDTAAAGRLLDEAGWKRQGNEIRTAQGVTGVADGTRLAIDFLHFPTFAKYGEVVRQQLAAVGIDVTQKPLEPAVFRNPRSEASARISAMAQKGVERLDIPAFLRRQAD